jgi:hypothetical protein
MSGVHLEEGGALGPLEFQLIFLTLCTEFVSFLLKKAHLQMSRFSGHHFNPLECYRSFIFFKKTRWTTGIQGDSGE